jgi:hypothetical protein
VKATATRRKGTNKFLTSPVNARSVSWRVVATGSDSARTVGDVDHDREAMHTSDERDAAGTCEADARQVGMLKPPESAIARNGAGQRCKEG